MDYTSVILDNRIPFKLVQTTEGENVIYCKSFKDELFDSGFFSTKEKDFVHNYITENNQKYIVTDVTTPDNKVYKNVKFKIVIDEKNETPYSTFNPSGKISEKKVYQLPEIKPLIIENVQPKKIIQTETAPIPVVVEKKKEEKHFKTTDSDLCTLVILDNRVPFKLIQTKEGESVIFCKGFKDELLDSGLFFTKEKDFVHNYVIENGQKYIITDVTTPDDKVYKNIKFRVVVNENEETPHSIFNPENVITENSEYKLPKNEPPLIEKNEFKETTPTQIDLSKNYALKKQEDEYLEKAKELQSKLIEEKVKLETERKELKKQQLLVENEKAVNEKLNDYKQIILQEFFNVSEKQEKTIKEKLTDNYKLLEEKFYEQNKIQNEQAKKTLDQLNEKGLEHLRRELDSKINDKQKEIEKLVEDKAEDSTRLLVEKADDLRKLFEDKFVVDLEQHKNDLFEKFNKLSRQVIENFVDEKAESIVEELTKQLVEAKKEVEKQDKQEKQQEQAEEKSQLQTDIKNLVNKEIANYQKDLAEQLNDLRASIEQEIAVTAAGAGEGGGGNNSYDYYPGGGPMNGNLSFPVSGTGIIFANGQLLSSYPSGGGGGDPAVNALVYSNSANWNIAYTNLIYNSAAYLSAYDMSLINSASSNWNNTYTQYSQNSGNYATIGFVDGKFLPLSGGAITGNLTIQGNLTALGSATFANTIFTTTSAVSVINTGPGPALYVFQSSGPYDVASFYDGDGVEVLHIGNANPGGNGFVGINESFPTVELSVRGAVSASKTVTALGGNSNQWNVSYTNLVYNSTAYLSAYDIIPTVLAYLSANNISLSGVSISPIATDRNIARSLQDKFTEILSVKDFGAKGDGVTNDYAAIQSALIAISGTARLFIPRGTYVISQELKIGSNSYIYGEGIDTTTIRLSSNATASQNVLTNSQNTRSYLTNKGNENIVIKDLTVDGNNGRFSGSYSPGTNTNGCCIGFANVTNAIIENVGTYNAPNHCIDIAASEYAISTNPLQYTPGPSTQIHLKNIKAYGSGDDCITTHFSRNILIENCYVTGSSGTLVPTNANGLEIDDGSYDIFVLGGYVKNCIRGIEIKGHATVPAAKRVRVEGLTVENCTRNFELRHIGFDSGNSATAFDVQLLNCTSISPVSTNTDAALRPRYLKISNYGGVVVRDFTCAGLCDTTNLVSIQEGAKDVLIDGLSFQSISGSNTGITESLLKIESDTLRNVTLRNIRFYNCVGLPLYAIGSVPGLVIDGLYATTTVNPSSNYVINVSWSPADVPYTIKNVSTTGYLSAYTLGTINANYSTPRNVEFIENIVPANASRALTVARFGWREGDSQGLNAGVGTRIDFTGNIFTGVSANQNVTVGYVGTEKINGTDTDLSSNLVLGTADSNSISASNKMLISPTGNVLIGTGSTVGLNSKLTVLGTISSTGVIFTTGGNSNNWNSTYTTVNSFSSTWSSGFQTLSFDENTALLSITNGNTVSLSALSGGGGGGGGGDPAVNNVVYSNSANWNSTYTSLNTNSAKYDSVYTQTTNLSTYWAGNSLLINSDTYVDSSVSNYLVDSDTQSIICYLPTNPQYGTTFTFQDMFNNWNTYNLTISSNDNMIMGKPLFEPLICDVPGITFTIVYVGGIWGWKVQ